MGTVELRRYDIAPGMMEPFLDGWRKLVPIREANGFRLLWAYADDDNSKFIWAIEHDGDFAAGEQGYLASPERVAVAGQISDAITGSLNAKVRPMTL